MNSIVIYAHSIVIYAYAIVIYGNSIVQLVIIVFYGCLFVVDILCYLSIILFFIVIYF